MSDELSKLNTKLLDQMYETMQVRFRAGKRFNFLDRSLAVVNSIASGYLIWVSIWALGRPLCPPASTLATLMSSGLAILLLCITLLVYASRFGELSKSFFASAHKLNKLHMEFRLVHFTADDQTHLQYAKLYYNHLDEHQLIHSEMDHRHFRFMLGRYGVRSRIFVVQNWIRIQLASYYPLVILFVATSVVAGTVIWVEYFTNWTSCVSMPGQTADFSPTIPAPAE